MTQYYGIGDSALVYDSRLLCDAVGAAPSSAGAVGERRVRT